MLAQRQTRVGTPALQREGIDVSAAPDAGGDTRATAKGNRRLKKGKTPMAKRRVQKTLRIAPPEGAVIQSEPAVNFAPILSPGLAGMDKAEYVGQPSVGADPLPYSETGGALIRKSDGADEAEISKSDAADEAEISESDAADGEPDSKSAAKAKRAKREEIEPFNWMDAVPVLPYQRRWIRDDSKLKIAVWSRQSGKSFAAALRAVLKCMDKRTTYIILSKGERQSRLFMEKVKDFCQVFKELKTLREFSEMETDDKTMEVYFPHNRSRIIGLPANADAARGYSGNIVLDEFAFHGDAHKIFAACFPIITRGYSIEVISTPNGTAGKFYEIAKAAGLVGSSESGVRSSESDHPGLRPPLLTKEGSSAGTSAGGLGLPDSRHRTSDFGLRTSDSGRRTPNSLWSGHRVDIYDAVRAGLPADIQLLRSGCDDEETWLQEYGCQFLSDAQNYIPIELISSCVHEEATTEPVALMSPSARAGGDTRATTGRGCYLGVDIGRKRDLTIAWLFEKVGEILWSRRLLVLKGVSFDEQERQICALIEGTPHPHVESPASSLSHPLPTGEGTGYSSLVTRHSSLGVSAAAVRRVCIDQSGIGMMLAEHLVQRYGSMVEPVTFTAQLKERLAPKVKMAFEERTVRIPDNREVRADINSVKRFVTLAGNVRFDAEHTDRGHADRFWALAMVVNAASEPTGHFDEVAGLVGSPVMAGFQSLVL